MKLRHFANSPRTLDQTKVYSPEELAYKPQGLWVSNEECSDSWSAWCNNNLNQGWNLDSLKYEYKVEFKDDINVIILNEASQLDDFTNQFSNVHENRIAMYNLGVSSTYIKWKVIQTMFDGILIPHYQWNRRMSLFWYYGWDCASGCIWNLDKINTFELIKN